MKKIRLLIVTQKVDENDPVLGFVCRWIQEFAKHFETITVIGFYVGEYHLPKNVSVYSAGKEKGYPKWKRGLTYVSLLVSLQKHYTHVYAHMSPEFVLVGGPLWKLWGKYITLWYNHTAGDWRLTGAAWFSKKLFHTSPYAASARFPQAVRMPAGIDTQVFKPQDVPKKQNEVYFQGRVAPAKRVWEIAEAVRRLRMRGTLATLTVVGPEEPTYAEKMKTEFGNMIDERALLFIGPKKSTDTPVLYSAAKVSVNLTAAGNYDKTVLESMACGTPAIVSSPAFADLVPAEWIIAENNIDAVSSAIKKIVSMPTEIYKALGKELREEVIAKHEIQVLAETLFKNIQNL
ncbi:MAG: glycosyltransferase family 4 protein [Patescibacteria group bacterium]|nr:glycosyltransferase family 4 protein [Patescibacteria group bacterium]